MKWTDKGAYFACDRYPQLRCYKRHSGRPMTQAEYEQVLAGTSPLFRFESGKRRGHFFQARLRLDEAGQRFRYDFADESARESAPPPPPSPVRSPVRLPPPDLKPTPTLQEEIGWLRSCLQIPQLHNLPFVLVAYRMIAPNNPTVKEEPKMVPVGILELAVAEDLNAEKVQQIAQVVQPRAKALLEVARRLQTKAYMVVMAPTNSHFWTYNLTDREGWETKTTQTMPGFLSLLRRTA